jgi:hypothetical protein
MRLLQAWIIEESVELVDELVNCCGSVIMSHCFQMLPFRKEKAARLENYCVLIDVLVTAFVIIFPVNTGQAT